MKELEDWIKTIQRSHPNLKGHSICPFAKANTYKIIQCSINDIKPLDEEFGVVIFVVVDDLDLDYGYQKIEEFNGVQTNNGMYNLILYQNAEFLTKMRHILAKTNYYDLWDDEYLQKILEKDYESVQTIRKNKK
jgi:peptidyl-tRNA hydrolase